MNIEAYTKPLIKLEVNKMKKFSILLLVFVCVLNLTACSHNSSQTSAKKDPVVSSKTTPDSTPKNDNAATKDVRPSSDSSFDSSSKNTGNNLEAGLGDLKLNYNNKWTYDKEKSQDASLAFTRGNALIGVTCSEEDSYQCPEDMVQTSKNMLSSTDGYKLLKDMKSLQVNGEKWCQITYETGTGDEKQINIQRCYGKNYYAYTITYSALKSNFEQYKSNALAIMDSCKMDVPSNKTGERAAKKELVGEFDAGSDGGYLVLNNDGTYYWYMDSSKSMDNVHYGTYGCDNQIKSMNVTTGHGYYLCLFPEKFFADGKETDMGTYKIQFAISNTSTSGVKCDYSALNTANSKVYYLNRTK